MSTTTDSTIELSPQRLRELLDSGEVQLVDVRETHEYEAGHIAGSRHIEFDQVTAEAESIAKDVPVVFQCRGGNRSAMIAEAFRTAGYDAYHIEGGLLAWAADGLPLEPEGGRIVERGVKP